MSWETLDKAWDDCRDGYYLMGRGSCKRRDLAAKIEPVASGWCIVTWPGPYTSGEEQTMYYKGTLEDAKAVAYATVKL